MTQILKYHAGLFISKLIFKAAIKEMDANYTTRIAAFFQHVQRL